MAERLMKYQMTTPPRFRTKKQGAPPATSKETHELTKPKTPNLRTKARNRPVCVESAAEKEEKEVKEIETCVCMRACMFNAKAVAFLLCNRPFFYYLFSMQLSVQSQTIQPKDCDIKGSSWGANNCKKVTHCICGSHSDDGC